MNKKKKESSSLTVNAVMDIVMRVSETTHSEVIAFNVYSKTGHQSWILNIRAPRTISLQDCSSSLSCALPANRRLTPCSERRYVNLQDDETTFLLPSRWGMFMRRKVIRTRTQHSQSWIQQGRNGLKKKDAYHEILDDEGGRY